MMPGLFGEAPKGENGRDAIMNAFQNATSHICMQNNITYFNIRDYMFQNMPPANWSHWLNINGIKSGSV